MSTVLSRFDPVARLFKTKQQLEKELTERRSAIIQAERAVANCKLLETDLPKIEAEIRCRDSLPSFDMETADDREFDASFELEAVSALHRLSEDLPAIRKHWDKVSKGLAAVS